MNRDLKQMIPIVAMVSALSFLVGCGQQGLKISNSAFTTSTSAARLAVEGVEEFKFCVARIRLETKAEKDANTAIDDNGSDSVVFTPGLINLSDGTAKDWGELAMPAKAQVARIKIKVKKDAALCGVDYSLLFNGLSTPRDIEFRWNFDPPIDVDSTTKALRLSFQEIAAALLASAMNDEIQLKERIESADSTAKAE